MQLSALRRQYTSNPLTILGILTSKYVFVAPRIVILDLCEACNTDCIMCQRHSPLVRLPSPSCALEGGLEGGHRWRSMDEQVAKAVISECAAAGTHKVILGESGEPTIHPHFDDLLDHAVWRGLSVTVMTNGLGVDDRRARTWSSKPAHFCVSVHAGDADTWLRVHPGHVAEDFERLSHTIEVLAQAGPQRVSLKCVVQRANFGRLAEVIRWARRLGVRDVRFRPVVASGVLEHVALTPDEEREALQELASCRSLPESRGISTNIDEYLGMSRYVRSGVTLTEGLYRRVPCYVGWHLMYVLADGTVVPCDDSGRVMGRAGEEPILRIWRSPQYQAFRSEAISMPHRAAPVMDCHCANCCLFRTNIRTHTFLHPFAKLAPERADDH